MDAGCPHASAATATAAGLGHRQRPIVVQAARLAQAVDALGGGGHRVVDRSQGSVALQ